MGGALSKWGEDNKVENNLYNLFLKKFFFFSYQTHSVFFFRKNILTN